MELAVLMADVEISRLPILNWELLAYVLRLICRNGSKSQLTDKENWEMKKKWLITLIGLTLALAAITVGGFALVGIEEETVAEYIALASFGAFLVGLLGQLTMSLKGQFSKTS